MKKKKKKLRLKKPFRIILCFLVVLLALSFYQLFKRQFEPDNQYVSDQVLDYEETLLKYAQDNEIQDYIYLLEAIMMQESNGIGKDPMQSSECEFNTQYEKLPNAINDPEYSIQVGVQYFAKCLKKAGATSPEDQDHIYLALQAYNYGVGYIDYVRYMNQGYTYQNAIDFSEKCKKEYCLDVYGDSKYVYHVLRYYHDTTLVDNWLELYH